MNRPDIQRISALFMIFFALTLMWIPVSAYAQNARVTLNLKGVTLEQAMNQIENQTNYLFVYEKDINLNELVSIDVDNQALEVVISKMLSSTSVNYQIKGTNIVLSKKQVAQAPETKLVHGVVSGNDGEPLIGATIAIKGTNLGTTTSADGSYSLNINGLDQPVILIFDYLGYNSQQIELGTRTLLDVTMTEDLLNVETVVVTALGIKRSEKALSYNVQQVDAQSVMQNKDVNFINSLNGKVAGVVINSSSSGVGGSSRVVMRGVKSISQSSNAMYVIDGIPIMVAAGEGDTEFGSQGTTDPIAELNPDDIESISVLNGAAAAALYGSDAANGAIVINTKSGTVGKTRINISSGIEVMTPFVVPEFQNRYGTGDYNSTEGSTIRSWGEPLNASNASSFNPINDYFQTGTTYTNSFSISGGTDKNQTYISAASVNSDGVIPNNSYNKYNFTFRNTTYLSERFKLDVGASYIMQDDTNMTNQGTYGNPLVGAYLFPRSSDWNDIKMYERYDVQNKVYTQYWPMGDFGMTVQNPYWINYRNLKENSRDRYMLNASMSYEIADWINLGGRVRVDNTTNIAEDKFYGSTNTQLTEGSNYGLYSVNEGDSKQTYADVLANINKRFSETWSLTANIGASISDMSSSMTSIRGPIRDGQLTSESASLMNVFNVQNLSNTNTTRLQSAWREQTQSVFASTEIGYKNTYYLSVTARNDWPSALAGPHSTRSSFFYPSVGLSAVLSEAISMPEEISFLKLRASYASVGVAFERYIANPQYQWDASNLIWSVDTCYPAYNLLPERTHSYEVGLTARFLKYFNTDLTLYHTNTLNQTFYPQVSTSSGSSEFPVQSGNVANRGVELAFGFENTWGKFSWTSNYTLSMNRNKIVELGNNLYNPITGESFSIDLLDMGGLNKLTYILKEGGSMGDMYSTIDLRRDSNNDIYIDSNGGVETATITDPDEYIYLGSALPKANMAWSNNFSYGNFNLSFMIAARIGGVVYSQTQATLDNFGVSEASAAARDAGGVIINGDDLVDANTWYTAVATGANTVPQQYIYDATNVRLQELSIGYTFPRKMLGDVCDINLSLVGRNLLMIYCKAPFDPEMSATIGNYYQGIDYFMSPSLRNIGFNLKFTL